MSKEHEGEEFTTKEYPILDLAISYVIQGNYPNEDLFIKTKGEQSERELKAFRFGTERCLF